MDRPNPLAPDVAPADSAPTLDARAKRTLLWLIAFSFFMQMLDSTIVNTAAPSISTALAVTPLSIKTALISYTLSLAVFIPLSSWLADRFGTRRVFWAAIAIFTTGSLACGMAASLPMLVAARVLQGFGGAMMMPVGRLAILRSFSKAEFVGAMAYATIPGLIGPAIGPFLGGLFSTWLSWRMIFFVNLPFGLIGLWMTRRHMPDYRASASVPLDFAGFVLFGLGVGGLSWALEQVIEARYAQTVLIGLPAAILLAVYVWRSLRIAQPIVDLHLLRVRSFRIGINGSFTTRLGVGGVYFLLTLLFQVGFGHSPVVAGLLQTPQAIAMLSTRFFVAAIIRHFGYRRVLIVNTTLAGLMILSFATFDAATPVWRLCTQVFVFGMVMSIQYTAVNTLGFVDLAPAQASMGSSMSSTAQNLSISFGIAFGSLLMALFLPAGATQGAAYVGAFQATMLILGIITMLSSAVFWRVPRSAAA
ncbi:MAG: MFS transporter [Proteobacteria bacterium]|uniref:MFS transporter n=1 Tax=Rudaea sp. TaxID=2136325 RepID=UPI001D1E6DAB|nr:MFS transporter [Pseudomonadota bacterium]MBS0567493.1 MFS transporter [Pseudomonadota bacterium]